MERFVLPHAVLGLLGRFKRSGKRAYLVGGCVRDGLMGLRPADFDIATDALPDETEVLFGDCRVIPTGRKHGTLTVIYDGLRAEITTFRREGGYSDRRRPDSVAFTGSAKEDAARRDFTVNAMFYSPDEGVLDFYGGQKDLERSLLRAVGDPHRRFAEDPLRILRGMRFAAQLGFNTEDNTAKAMKELAYLVGTVAAERTLAELKQLFRAEDVDRVTCEFFSVIEQVFGFSAPVPKVNGYLPNQRLAVFIAEYGGSQRGALECAARLKPDKELSASVKAAISVMYGKWLGNRAAVAHAAADYGVQNAALMCAVAKARGLFVSEDFVTLLDELKEGKIPMHTKDLNISAQSIDASGAKLGEVLSALYDYAHNEREFSATALELKAAELVKTIKEEESDNGI